MHRPPAHASLCSLLFATPSRAAHTICIFSLLTVELVLLAVAFMTCLVMWVLARLLQPRDNNAAVSSGESMVAASQEASYRRLRNLYLSVYALATFGDWIQGGFLYALYAEYGYSMRAVSLIFVVGYASAATVGTYVAAIGDLGGHRRNCVAYGILYSISCLLCNSPSLWALLVGRVLGGVAYSILYTSFESWLIAEADARRLPMSLLSKLFSVATFTNAGTAVIAGMVGHLAVEVIPHTVHNKFASAFDVGAIVLLIAACLAAVRWGERFGNSDGAASSASESLWQSCRAIRRSRELLYLGLVNSYAGASPHACTHTRVTHLARTSLHKRPTPACTSTHTRTKLSHTTSAFLSTTHRLYEAALYVFVFLWTPALERRASLSVTGSTTVGHGLVFSIFMLSKMAGSQAFHALSMRLSPAAILQVVFAGSAGCLASPLLTDSYERTLLAFCGFEALLGMYWPAIALLRCGALDDSQRASTMAVFRVLLNVLVITILPLAGGLPEGVAFSLGSGLLLVCLACIGVVKQEEEELQRSGGRVRRGTPSPVGDMKAVVGDGTELSEMNGADEMNERTGLKSPGAVEERESTTDMSSGDSDSGTGGSGAPVSGDGSERRKQNGYHHHHGSPAAGGSPMAPASSAMPGGGDIEAMDVVSRVWEYAGSMMSPRRGKYSPVTVSAGVTSHANDGGISPPEEERMTSSNGSYHGRRTPR